MSTLKKDSLCESCELSFIWRQNDHCGQRNSTSDNSEKLLQRGRGREVNICDFGEGEVHAIKHLSYKSFSASHEELMPP